MPKPPTKASGLDNASSSDSKRQLERLRAENADLTKDFLALKNDMRDLVESMKKANEKKPAASKAAKPEEGA
jgi:hypothetical protein